VLWTNGDLEMAKRKYAAGMANIQRAGNLSDLMGCALAVADIQIAQGRLRDSMRTFEWALHLAEQHGTPALRGSADMLVGMSELYREQDNIPGAVQLLARSKEQGEHTGLPQNRYRWRVAMALIREAEGDLDGALALLDEAGRVYMSDFSPEARPIAALKARVWVRQGRLEEAFAWADEQKLSCEENLSYLREFAHITLARIHLAGFRRDQDQPSIQSAQALLERLLAAAESGGRMRSAIEIRILQALVHQARANISAAVARIQPALALGEKEGFVRLFVDEGPALKQILLAAAARKIHPAYVERLLAAFEPRPHAPNEDALLPKQSRQNRTSSPSQVEKTEWIEPLSQRELDVLRLFRSELSGPEIARELMVALSTVRTHTKSIYAKLNVNSRRLAVKRAIELKLI
jgi:LuxR family maltose regulon positive regulatory protein